MTEQKKRGITQEGLAQHDSLKGLLPWDKEAEMVKAIVEGIEKKLA